MNAFDTIHAALQGEKTRRGEYAATCPNCGKEAKKGQSHFGYNEQGQGHCFVCSWGGGPAKLAELLRLDLGEYVPPVRVEKPEPEIAKWRLNPWKLLDGYKSHPERLARWQAYKPLSAETLDRHGFGFGALPFRRDDDSWYMSRDKWLTCPVYEDGALVAIRGRNITDRGPKWIMATGSAFALWNVDNVQPGSICWITENIVDAAWLMERHPEWSAVSIGGASVWRDEWTRQLVGRKPGHVIVALDRDLPGNGGDCLRDELIQQWHAEHPGARIPKTHGPIIANSLLRAGQQACLFDAWPADAPAKAGIDWILERMR